MSGPPAATSGPPEVCPLLWRVWLLLTRQPPGHDHDTALTRLEEQRESFEPHELSPTGSSAGVGRAAADPSPPVGGGHLNPLTACPICGETLICVQACEEMQ